MRRPPFFVQLAFAVIRAIAFVVPHRHRAEWRREWEAEIAHGAAQSVSDARPWRLLSRSVGSLVDAAWLRRQFTRDSEAVHDLARSWRVFRSRPAIFGAAVVVLAIAIAAVAASFTALHHFVLAPLPYADADRLVTVWESRPSRGEMQGDVAPANFIDWRQQATTFSQMAAAEPWSVDFRIGGRVETVTATKVTAGFFDLLGRAPYLGRTFTDTDFRTGDAHVVILSYGFWQRRFGGDGRVIGSRIMLDGSPHEVVGVLPRDFDVGVLADARGHDTWLPDVIPADTAAIRAGGWWNVIGRVRRDRSLTDAQHELDAISAALALSQPQSNKDMRALIVPLKTHLSRGIARPATILTLVAIIVLLVACSNVANLLITVGLERRQEFAIRGALGASRARLLRQLLVESLGLTVTAATMGAFLAAWMVRALAGLVPSTIPRAGFLDAGAGTAGGALLGGAIAVLIAGWLPAIVATRASSVESLHGARTAGHRGRSRLRDAFAIAEVALTLALVAASALLFRSFSTLANVTPGFSPSGVVALQMFAYDELPTPDAQRAFFGDVLERMQASAGVVVAGAVSAMPFTEADVATRVAPAVEGAEVDPARRPRTYLTIATPGFFDAMRIPLLRGRLLSADDTATAAPVAVMSSTSAAKLFGASDPLGRFITLRRQNRPVRIEIVGVVGDIHHVDLDTPVRDEIYVPFAQSPSPAMTFVVRASGEPAALIDTLQRHIWALRPDQPIHDTAIIEARIREWLAPRRLALGIVAILSAITLLVAVTGVYGVISYSAQARSLEMSVRLALGASRADVVRLVLRHAFALAIGGLATGLVGAAVFGRLLQRFLFGVTAYDPWALGAAAAVLGAAAIIAAWLPAWRASQSDPARALRV